MSAISCGVCNQPVNEMTEDIVLLNGSCKHKHHFRCYVESYVMKPDQACRLCDSKMDPSLWDNPLELSPAEPAEPTFLTPFRALATFVSDKLDTSIDNSLKSIMKQNLPVATLKLKGCTPESLLQEMDTGLFSFLMNETKYTSRHLTELGFNWDHYLRAGFTSLHVKKARQRFDLFKDIIKTVPNLNDLCSNDIEVIKSLDITPEEWRLICNVKPVCVLYKLGMRTGDLIDLGYSLQDWQEIMGLDKLVMQQLYKFRTEEYLEFIQTDQRNAEEFVHRFKYNPLKNVFGNGRTHILRD